MKEDKERVNMFLNSANGTRRISFHCLPGERCYMKGEAGEITRTTRRVPKKVYTGDREKISAQGKGKALDEWEIIV